ncbi:MAG: ABC transporter permease [Alphaproteobacteria bacterium]|nr:ABC transporter permease [Alphaproteobacteria bacterium]
MQRVWFPSKFVLNGCILFFLIAPVLVIIPLSFNVEPYFTFTPGMLALEADAYSLRWYEAVLGDERWLSSIRNSFVVAIAATFGAMALGTLAALGLSSRYMPRRELVNSIIIAPMIIPLIISATGIYFFYAQIGLANTLLGIIIAHIALGVPFVVITVTATLAGFDSSLVRASATLGATPWMTFRRVTLPIISPGVFSGGLFAFGTSFDEVVVVLFIAANPSQYTIPRQMWSGIREQISPAILAMASLLIVVSMLLILTTYFLRRRYATS